MKDGQEFQAERITWNTRSVVALVGFVLVVASTTLSAVLQFATKGDVEDKLVQHRAETEKALRTVVESQDKAIGIVAEGVKSLREEAVKTREKLGEIEVNTAKTAATVTSTNQGLSAIQGVMGKFVTREVIDVMKDSFDKRIDMLERDLSASKQDRIEIHRELQRLQDKSTGKGPE